MSDRVGVMRAGRLEQVGTPAEIYGRPANRFVAEFVGSANLFEGVGDGTAVRTDDGLAFPSPVRGPAAVLVRPERVRVDGAAGLAGEVQEVLFQGATTRVILRVGARRVVAEDGAEGLSRLRAGDAVRVSWDPSDARVLPPAAPE